MKMKRLGIILLAGVAYCATISAQTQVMTVIKADGTKTVFNMADVERVNFDELTAADNFEEGEGTEASPYIIANTNQLLLMAKMINSGDEAYTSAYYELTDDIDLMGMEWTPIGEGRGNTSIDLAESGAFSGVFNGNGHTISNLYINATATDHVAMYGLFGFVGSKGVVSNLTVTGSVKATSSINDENEKNTLICGGIAGAGASATFSNCTFKGSVVADYPVSEASVSVGGVVGHLVGLLSECSAIIAKGDSVCGEATYTNVGALAGYVNAGSVTNCSTTVEGLVNADCGQFTTTNSSANAGGMVGNSFGGSLTGCTASVGGKVQAYAVPDTDAASSYASASAGGMCGSYAADQNANNTVSVTGDVCAEGCGTSAAGGMVGNQTNAGYGASGIHTAISGTVSALNHGTEGSKMLAYAGGVYGTASFQYASAQLADCSSNVSGEISAKANVAAYAGGVAGSASATVADHATITSTGKVTADAPIFATCGGVIGNALASSCACYSIIDGSLSVSAAESGSQVGCVFGSMSGSKRSRKSALACYTLVEGSVTGGEESAIGAITGQCTAYSMPETCYWWSGNEAVKSDTGADEAADGKLDSRDESTLKTAMETMNAAIEDNGSYTCKYTYNAETGMLEVVSTSGDSAE